MQTLQEHLKKINNSTLQNMRFLLESYSNEVLEAIDQQNARQAENQDAVLIPFVEKYHRLFVLSEA